MTTYYLSQQITVSAGTVITSWEIAVAGLATTTMSCHFETDSGSGPTGTTVSGSTVDLTKVFSATMTYETFTPASPLTMLAGTYNVVCHNPGDLQWGYKSGGSFYYDADGAGAYTHNEANGLSIKVNGCGSGS